MLLNFFMTLGFSKIVNSIVFIKIYNCLGLFSRTRLFMIFHFLAICAMDNCEIQIQKDETPSEFL